MIKLMGKKIFKSLRLWFIRHIDQVLLHVHGKCTINIARFIQASLCKSKDFQKTFLLFSKTENL